MYLKTELKYTYKKGSSTSTAGSTERNQLLQSMHASQILQMLLNKSLIISIDEWSFNRDLKNNYAWLPKGISSKVINIMTFGRCTLISAVFSDGNFIWMMVQDTVKSKKFCRFLQILKYVPKQSKVELMANISITLGNAPVHTSLE